MKLSRSQRKETNPADGGSMSLLEHLAELRGRIVKAAVAVTVGAIVAYFFYGHILNFFTQPYCQVSGKTNCALYVTGPLEGFALRIKIAGYGGLLLASPVILYQLWRFVTPGLNPREKRYAVPFVLSSLLLFMGGALVAYITFPHALQFLQSAGGRQLHDIYTPNSYLNLIFLLMIAFGISFEFPVLLVALELAGVLTPKKLSSFRRWAIVIIFAVVAVFIPSSDPFSMFAMAIPLVVFYEVSILIGRLVTRRRARLEAAAE